MRYPDAFEKIWGEVRPFTMTSKNRGFALYEAVHHVLRHNIPGSFVECGVWRGGSAMIIAHALMEQDATRRIFLFDTFEGMTDPGENDLDPSGKTAAELLNAEAADGPVHAACDLKTVRDNMLSTGFKRELVVYVPGDVRQTLPYDKLTHIALLRLDTDFEDSTAAELKHLYPLVSPWGVVIIDDYGHWQGAKVATDAFLKREATAGRKHFLAPLDYTGRLFVKPAPARQPREPAEKDPQMERYDYVSPGMDDPGIVAKLTSLVRTDPAKVAWPYLRREVPHVWRTDARARKPLIGVLSVDEGAVLYHAARPFAGLRGLEIGCHLGFSTAHLAKAGLDLDVIDPALGDAAHLAHVQDTLDSVAPGHAARLQPGFSPGLVPLVHEAGARAPWHFAFIDGLHDGDAPINDARAVEPFMAETAAVAFHDLVCPDVARGLRFFADQGWNIRLYNTMQVMGLAWRGAYTPPPHIADPAAATDTVDHLSLWRDMV